MREVRNFGARTPFLNDGEVRKKYFLVYEGMDTEPIYFAALARLRDKVKLNPMIELVPLLRSYGESGWSHPEKLIDMIKENLSQRESSEVSYHNLIAWIMDCCSLNEKIQNKSLLETLFTTLKWICQNKLLVQLDDRTKKPAVALEKILSELEEVGNVSAASLSIQDILRLGTWTYDAEIDKVCFVVDRDKGHFSTKQYQNVSKVCHEKGYSLCVTNPCFEFWLLMHFDDVGNISKEKMLENAKVTEKCRYAENELRKRMPGYHKTSYKAGPLIERIDAAISNERQFCETLEELEDHIGSNIGKFIDSIRTQDS